MTKVIVCLKIGNKRSGHRGHRGRPGQRGGSLPSRLGNELSNVVDVGVDFVTMLSDVDMYGMTTRQIREWQADAERRQAALLSDDSEDQDAIVSLSAALRASTYGGAALAISMRAVKTYMNDRIDPSDNTKKALNIAIARGDIDESDLAEWDRAFPYFLEHAEAVRYELQRRIVGSSVTLYHGIDKKDAIDTIRSGELPTLDVAGLTSYSSRQLGTFGTSGVVNVHVKDIYASYTVSPLFVDMVEAESLAYHSAPINVVPCVSSILDADAVVDYVRDVARTLGIPEDMVVEKGLDIKESGKQTLIQARTHIFYDASDRLAERMFTGEISLGQWQEDMKALIRGVHTSCTAVAKGGWDEMSWQEWGRLGTPLRNQYRYLNGFAQHIDETRDTISLKAIQARARLYGDGAGGSAILVQAGVELEKLLPWLPKDGSTECLNRCHCRWELLIVDTLPDKRKVVQAIWRLGKAEHCLTCLGRDGHTVVITVSGDVTVPDVIGGY